MFDQYLKKSLLAVLGGGIAMLVMLAVPAAAQAPEPAAVTAQARPGKVKLPPARSLLDQVRRAGVLRVGVVEQIPWTFTDRSGQLAGFEVDVARALASDLGVRLELVRASATGIADDVAERYVFTVIDANRPDRPPLQVRLDEVDPMTEAGRLNIDSWAQNLIVRLIEDLAYGVEQGLVARGYQAKPTPAGGL